MEHLLAALLVAGLGADDSEIRDWSEAVVSASTLHANWRLPMTLSLSSDDPEVRRRARCVQADLETLVPSLGHFPRLEALRGFPPSVANLHDNHLRHARGAEDRFGFWSRTAPQFRSDCMRRCLTGEFALQCVRAGMSRGAVLAMLDDANSRGEAPVAMPKGFEWDGD